MTKKQIADLKTTQAVLMNERIISMQQRIGTVPDGIWGPKSKTACRKWLREMMPYPHPWPGTSQTALRAFYGSACDEDQIINMPAPVPMFYDGKKVKTIRCHRKVADSLGRALTAAYEDFPNVVKIYDGIYNCRPMSGGSSPSLHARAAAIDMWADKNGFKVPWPTEALMPLIVMEHFAREGWLSGGAFWGYDGMHHQATQ